MNDVTFFSRGLDIFVLLFSRIKFLLFEWKGDLSRKKNQITPDVLKLIPIKTRQRPLLKRIN